MRTSGGTMAKERSAAPHNAERHLRRLLEISELLARFDTAAHTLPLILAAAARSLPLRSMVVLDAIDGRPRNTVWHAPGVRHDEVSAASERAAEAFSYLTRRSRGRAPEEPLTRGVRVDAMPTVPQASGRGELRFVSLPLVLENHPAFGVVQVGVLLVEASTDMDEIDLAFLNAVAHQLSIAIDRDAAFNALIENERRARAFAAEEARRATLAQAREALFGRSAAQLSSALSVKPTVDRLAELIVSAVGSGCVVFLREASGAGLRVAAVTDREPAARERLRRRVEGLSLDENDRGVVLAAIEGGEVAVFGLDGDARQERAASFLRGLDAGSAIAAPLQARGQLLGGVLVLRRADEPGFSESDVEYAREFAWRGAIAIDNALLFEREARAVRAREDILAIVSHDLRNPLSAVTTNIAAALSSVPLTDARARKLLEGANRAAQRMRGLVTDLLDFTNIERGRLSLDARPTDAHSLVREGLEAAEVTAAAREVTLCSALPDAALPVVADRERVLQVLGNLIDNALRFTPPGGSVELSASRTHDAVRFCVADTGAGMSTAILEHVFERYWKGDSAGTGLGLAIVRGIVEAHGGRVWAESAPGEGTRMFFDLPGPPTKTSEQTRSPVAT